MKSRRWAFSIAALVVAATVSVGCGDDTDSDTDAAGQAKSTATVQLPDSIKSKGTVRVATSADNPPMEFLGDDGSTVEGFDADMAAELAKVTGVKFEFTNVGFDSIIPGLAAGKYDIAIAGMFDTLERQEVLTFVDYQRQGTNVLVPAGNPEGVQGLEDLCGKVVSAQKASTQAAVVEEESKKHCADDPIDVDVYTDLSAVVLAVSSGRAKAAAGPGPSNADVARKQEGQFETVGPNYRVIPVGIAIPKEQEALAQALQKAVQQLIDDGTYADLLDRWGLAECCSLDEARINSGTS